MKIDFVYKVLPVFIRQKTMSGYRGLTRFNYIVMNSLEDEVCLAHEKIHAGDNYKFILLPVILTNILFYFGLIYWSYGVIALHMAILAFLFTSRGKYFYEVRAFRENVRIETENYTKNVESVYLKNANIIKKNYGAYANSLPVEKIIKDLKKGSKNAN